MIISFVLVALRSDLKGDIVGRDEMLVTTMS